MFPDNDLFSTPQHLGPLLSDADGHFVTVAVNGLVPAEITLSMAGSIEVIRSGADLVVCMTGGCELLRLEAAQITLLSITDSVGNEDGDETMITIIA
jgi:hypothetical protein